MEGQSIKRIIYFKLCHVLLVLLFINSFKFSMCNPSAENSYANDLEQLISEFGGFNNDAKMVSEEVLSDDLKNLLSLVDSSEVMDEPSGADVFDIPDNFDYVVDENPLVTENILNKKNISYSTTKDNGRYGMDEESRMLKKVSLDDVRHGKLPRLPNRYGKHQSSLAFVFDSTGSMWDDLQQLKEGAEKIMMAMEERDDNPIYNYVLVPFHDPEVGPVTVTRDRELFRQKLDQIDVYGGGDCPEMSLGGINQAIDASLPKSYIYVLTDAISGDPYLVNKILDKIQRKQIQVVFVLTGDCNNRTGDGYKVYEKIASASSGQIFHLDKSDVNQVLNFVRDTLDSRRVSLIALHNISPNRTEPHNVKIDESLEQITISVSGKNPEIDVVNPEGVHVKDPPKVKNVIDLDNIKVINVNEPETGNWEIKVKSDSNHSLRLTGLTDLSFDYGFSVDKPHNLDETTHRPLHGAKNYLVLKPSNPSAMGNLTTVDIVNLNGQPIKFDIPVFQLPGTNDTYISEKFKPPAEFFNLVINGYDKNDHPFFRLTNTAIKPQFPDKPFVSTDNPEVFHPIFVPLNLSCHVESLIPVTVQWFKNGKPITDPVTKNQSGWFYWHDLYPSVHAAGTYICQAKNDEGTSNEQIYLHMTEPPLLKKSNQTLIYLSPGATLSVDCYTIRGNPTPSIDWLKDGGKLPIKSNLDTFLNGTLTITDVTESDEGVYQCLASNPAGVDTFTLEIRIATIPNFLDGNDSKDQVVKVGDGVELKCLVAGKPEPMKIWIKNGEPVSEEDVIISNDNSSLSIPNLRKSHEAEYTCIASNKLGSINKTVFVNVTVPPRIEIIGDDHININEGDTLTLPCPVTGDPKPDVHWSFQSNSVDLSDKILDENNSLSFMVNVTDSGTYRCQARNIAGNASREWTVVVFMPPKITAPEDEEIHVKMSEDVELQCEAIGYPKPSIRWLKNSVILYGNDSVIIADNGNLILTNVDGKSDGHYICEAENEAGIARKTFSVIVKSPPKILEKIHPNIDLIQGEMAIIPCTATGNPTPATTWLNDGEIIKNLPDGSVKVDEENTLIITANSNANIPGTYQCEASNSEGIDKRNYHIQVLVPPSVTKAKTQIEVTEGTTVQIECPVVDSFPPPIVFWQKDQNILDDNEKYKNENKILVIQKVTTSDEGSYICIASNIVGEVEASVYLTVLYRPRIKNKVDKPIRVKKHVGDSLELKCEADGNPDPKIQWIRENESIVSENSELKMQNLTITDASNYTCKASNKIGSDESAYFLDILEPPSIVGPDSEELNVIRGELVVLECTAKGYPEPEIRWTHAGTEESGVKGHLKIYSVDYQHHGNYVCEAINTEGIATKSVFVRVRVPPSITTNPSNKTIRVLEKEKFSIECLVEGVPKPKVTWTKDNVELSEEDFQREFTARSTSLKSNLTRYSLTVRGATPSLSGLYKCVAQSILGNNSAEFNVTILAAPKLKLGNNDQKNFEVERGKPLELICNVDRGNPPSDILWLKNNETLSSDDPSIIYNSDRSILRISNASEQNRGEYKCVAVNDVGKVEQPFDVDILVPPETKDNSLIPVSVIAGDFLKLYCDISGNPKPTYMWLKHESTEIPNTDPKDPLLVLSNVTTENSGVYSCVGVNKVGTTKMNFNVEVLEPPHFLDNLPSKPKVNATINQGFVLRCDIDGTPSPNITWEKDNKRLFNHKDVSYYISTDGKSLQISNPLLSDAGKYKCEAQNLAGKLQRVFDVSVIITAQWEPWSPWSACSVTCGDGVRSRTRTCSYDKEFQNDTIIIDLSQCVGPRQESEICNDGPCSVDGGWSDWTQWTSCSETCGPGTIYRYRYCNNPTPAFGGKNCDGESVEKKSCNNRPCPQHGKWSEWTEWGPCSTTCGHGLRFRYRECNNPRPAYGGKECNGTYVESMECAMEPCPIDGGWSDWEQWTPCSVTCGLGRQSRKRYCTNPTPKYGGQYCTGENFMIKGCVLRPCIKESQRARLRVKGLVNGQPVMNSLEADILNFGESRIVKIRPENLVNGQENGWFPYTTFLISPVSFNLAEEQEMIGGESLETESEVNPYEFDDDLDFQQKSRIAFSTGQELLIEQVGQRKTPRGVMEVKIEMNGEVPIVQPESKILIDPFSEKYVKTSNKTRRTTTKNYINIDGHPVRYTWDNEIKFRSPHQRKRMIEKMPVENFATFYNPKNKEINTIITAQDSREICPKGYKFDRIQNACIDINECEERRCHASQICENTIGSFKCFCQSGFKSLGNGDRCLDINECSLDIHYCSHTCENLPGTYQCKCPPGMKLGRDSRSCIKSREKVSPPELNIIRYMNPRENTNEFNNDYISNFSAELDFGEYSNMTEECPTGYSFKDGECVDINECEDDPDICTVSQKCLNTKGAYFCIPAPCPEYYKREFETGSCIQFCNSNDSVLCSDNAEIAQKITYITLALSRADIKLGGTITTLQMDVFGKPLKYVSYMIQDSTSDDVFEVFTHRDKGILTCYTYPDTDRVHRITVSGNAYNNKKRSNLLVTTKYIIYLYISD